MNIKKLIIITLALIVTLSAGSATVFADENIGESITVYFTMTDKGQRTIHREAITVTDTDGNGNISIHDALTSVHDAKYEGGSEAGYSLQNVSDGTSVSKLWGDESGAFGFRINDLPAESIHASINGGDELHVFLCADTERMSDVYCYFDVKSTVINKYDTVTLKLSTSKTSPYGDITESPFSGAKITVNGEETSYKTDSEGMVTVSFNEIGEFTVSATSSSLTIVPPVCTVSVNEKPDYTVTVTCIAIAAIVASAVAVYLAGSGFGKNRSQKASESDSHKDESADKNEQ